jgi:hypothetical protein
VCGLAKEREFGEPPVGDAKAEKQPDRVFLPRTKDPIKLRPNTAELFVLSRIRDEAHRFAVSFHQKLREKGTIRSQLADIPGVGPKRQTALLKTLGSVRRVRGATVEELAAVPGMTLRAAQAVVAFYASGAAPSGGSEAPPPLASGAAPAAAPRANRRGRGAKSDAAALPDGATSDQTASSPAIAPVPENVNDNADDIADDIAEDAAAVELAELAGPAEDADGDAAAAGAASSLDDEELPAAGADRPSPPPAAKSVHDKYLDDLNALRELESQIADLAQASAASAPEASAADPVPPGDGPK